jgi:hypothetical protein
MTSALDMLQDSFEKLGVYAPGETISDANAQRGLKVLNDMIDSWSNESLTCYAILEQSAPLQVGVGSYTIGAGGTLNMTRPIRILMGAGTAYLRDSNGNRYPMDVVPQDKWNQIWNLTMVSSNIPNTIFYDPQFPLGIINVYPLYSGGMSMTMFWDSYLQLTEFPLLSTTVSLPPGYIKAIQDSLALQIGPYFKPDGWVPSQTLIWAAAESKANIKRANIRENIAVFEKTLTARGGVTYNIYADGYR